MARLLPLITPLLALMASGCSYDSYASGYAPSYPAGYAPAAAPGVAWASQPGDLFGGEDVTDVNAFVQPLSPYGRWVQTGWGLSFVPNAPQGWRPYQNGRWGPDRFWISNDPWGWATDHYGRWGFDQTLGWVWVPDTQWGPSWVAWREADDVYGWAPIPPRVNWSVGIGFASSWGWNDWNNWYGPSWVWVPRTYAFVPGFGGHVLPWNAGYNYWRGSRWNNGWGWGGGRPGWNNGWNVGFYAGNGWGWNHGWQNRWGHGGGWGWGWGGSNYGGRYGSWNNYRGPQRGAPGSVGDQIGRGIAGLPPGRPQPGWGNGGNWGGNRGNNGGNGGGNWGGGWNGSRPPRQGAPGSVGDQIGRGIGGGWGGGGMSSAPPMGNRGWGGGNAGGWGGGNRGGWSGGGGNRGGWGGGGRGGRRGIDDDGSSGAAPMPTVDNLPPVMARPPMATPPSAAPTGPSAMPPPRWAGNNDNGDRAGRGMGGGMGGGNGGGWGNAGAPVQVSAPAAPAYRPSYTPPAYSPPPRAEPPAFRQAPVNSPDHASRGYERPD
ncbi:MAG: DUF6600 domain-containing protein [Sphingomonadales bacterium]